MLADTENKIEIIENGGFANWLKSHPELPNETPIEEKRKMFYTEVGMSKLKKHLKHLRFILN